MPSHSEKIANIKLKAGLPVHPLGFYVLVELVEVETVSSAGIYIGKQEREQSAEECGFVRAVGPTAFLGWQGCEIEEMCTTDERSRELSLKEKMDKLSAKKIYPYQKWGFDIGDLVEFRAFEGKSCVLPNCGLYRYIPDSHIVGVVNGTLE